MQHIADKILSFFRRIKLVLMIQGAFYFPLKQFTGHFNLWWIYFPQSSGQSGCSYSWLFFCHTLYSTRKQILLVLLSKYIQTWTTSHHLLTVTLIQAIIISSQNYCKIIVTICATLTVTVSPQHSSQSNC